MQHHISPLVNIGLGCGVTKGACRHAVPAGHAALLYSAHGLVDLLSSQNIRYACCLCEDGDQIELDEIAIEIM